jgi:hypothetical protein
MANTMTMGAYYYLGRYEEGLDYFGSSSSFLRCGLKLGKWEEGMLTANACLTAIPPSCVCNIF